MWCNACVKGEPMRWRDWFEKWGMTSLEITTPFAKMEFQPKDPDKVAAWEMYIELLTRITTQSLKHESGDEATALKSVHSLFGTTREIIRSNGRGCQEFTKIAIVVLNQMVRPFTARWHRKSMAGAFENPEQCKVFRSELNDLQANLRIYTRMLADMAGVEDLTNLEPDKG